MAVLGPGSSCRKRKTLSHDLNAKAENLRLCPRLLAALEVSFMCVAKEETN